MTAVGYEMLCGDLYCTSARVESGQEAGSSTDGERWSACRGSRQRRRRSNPGIAIEDVMCFVCGSSYLHSLSEVSFACRRGMADGVGLRDIFVLLPVCLNIYQISVELMLYRERVQAANRIHRYAAHHTFFYVLVYLVHLNDLYPQPM